MKREDDYLSRRAQLASLSDEALYARFWDLTEKLVDPLLQLGRAYTSPAIERSVLLRMGFSSVEAKSITEGCVAHDLLKHGAGNVVYRYAKAKGIGIREAGLALEQGAAWDEVQSLFAEEAK